MFFLQTSRATPNKQSMHACSIIVDRCINFLDLSFWLYFNYYHTFLKCETLPFKDIEKLNQR